MSSFYQSIRMKKHQSIVEYALIIGLIAVGLIAVINMISDNNNKNFTAANDTLSDAAGVVKLAEAQLRDAKIRRDSNQFKVDVSLGKVQDFQNSPNNGSSPWVNPSSPSGNRPPIAEFVVQPESGLSVNTEISFLDISSDPDGDDIVKEEGQNRKNYYPRGEHIVKLRVADEYGNWSSWYSHTIEIGNSKPNKPIINMNPQNNLTPQTTITFEAIATDPDGQPVTFEWENKKSKYSKGQHTVTVRAKDSEGLYSEPTSITFTVLDIEEGIVASYDFNRNTYDGTKYKNNGTLKNNATYGAGVEGEALKLNGSSQYVYVPNSLSLRPIVAMTMEAWVNPIQGNGEKIILNKEHTYEMAIHNGKLSVAVKSEKTWSGSNANGWYWMSTDQIVPLNVWSHVATVYDGNVTKVYFNGRLVGTFDLEGGEIKPADSTTPLWIGGRSGYGSYFNGSIDNVKIYNIALSEQEIRNSYNAYSTKSINIPNINKNYWEMVTNTKYTGNNEAMYVSINNDPYVIPSNSYLQYDVYHDTNNPEFVASMELHFTDGNTLRDFVKDNSYSKDTFLKRSHPASDLSSEAKGKWYRRSVDLKNVTGKTISSVLLADETDKTGRTLFRIANIKIIQNGTIVRVINPTRTVTEIDHSNNKTLEYAKYFTGTLNEGLVADFNFLNNMLVNRTNNKQYSLNGATITNSRDGNSLKVNRQHISVPTSDLGLQNSEYVTVSFWYRWNGEGSVMPVAFSKYDYWCVSGYCGFNTAQGDVYGINNPYSTNSFLHTVVVFKKGNATGGDIYINGVKQTLSQKLSIPLNTLANFSGNFNISSWDADLYYLMNGSEIDEIKVWNRKLTSEEVTELYGNY